MCQVRFTAGLKMPCPLEANPLDTISKCCCKLTDSHQGGVLRKKWSKQAGKKAAARPEGEAQSSQSAEGEWVRNCGKHRRGVRVTNSRSSWDCGQLCNQHTMHSRAQNRRLPAWGARSQWVRQRKGYTCQQELGLWQEAQASLSKRRKKRMGEGGGRGH